MLRFKERTPDSYYSIFAAKLLSDRDKRPEQTPVSAMAGLLSQPFQPRAFRRAWILAIQRKLAAASYYGGNIDGLWGPQTDRGLAAFADVQSPLGPHRYGTLQRLGEYADSQDVTGSLSGRWSGRYSYRRPVKGVSNVPFEMDLVLSQSRIYGSVIEPNTFGNGSSRNLVVAQYNFTVQPNA